MIENGRFSPTVVIRILILQVELKRVTWSFISGFRITYHFEASQRRYIGSLNADNLSVISFGMFS